MALKLEDAVAMGALCIELETGDRLMLMVAKKEDLDSACARPLLLTECG